MDLLTQQELAATRAMVTATQRRVEKIAAKQDALALAVKDLTLSVDKLRKSDPTEQHEIERMKQMLTDTCEQLGTAQVNMHRDFSVLVQELGPAFAQVDRTIEPFAAAIAGFTETEEPVDDRSASV